MRVLVLMFAALCAVLPRPAQAQTIVAMTRTFEITAGTGMISTNDLAIVGDLNAVKPLLVGTGSVTSCNKTETPSFRPGMSQERPSPAVFGIRKGFTHESGIRTPLIPKEYESLAAGKVLRCMHDHIATAFQQGITEVDEFTLSIGLTGLSVTIKATNPSGAALEGAKKPGLVVLWFSRS
jgi:hypothetical protein